MANPQAELLKEILVYDTRGLGVLVAEKAGLAYRTVMDNTDLRANPNVEVIKAAWLVSGDPRLKKLLEPEGYELMPKACDVRPTKSVEGEATDVSIAKARLLEAYRNASADGDIDRKESIDIERFMDQLDREHEEFKVRIRMELRAGRGG